MKFCWKCELLFVSIKCHFLSSISTFDRIQYSDKSSQKLLSHGTNSEKTVHSHSIIFSQFKFKLNSHSKQKVVQFSGVDSNIIFFLHSKLPIFTDTNPIVHVGGVHQGGCFHSGVFVCG